ncbi:MAG: T9SS type A sorting domain-containing protein, partial [Bacteroidetes bacterium]
GFSIGSSGYIGTGVVYYVDPNNGHIKPYHPNVFWELHDSTACEITASIYPNNTTVCIGSSASIYASGGTNYSWSTGATTAVITVTPSVTTTYTVIVSDVNGCSDVASITVPVKNCCSVSPAISSDPSPGTTLCAGQNAYITASGGLSYLWNTGSTSAFIVATLSVTATYSVTVTDASGCTGTAAITFIVDPNCTSTGISQFDADALQINIWPNPSNGMFNVQWLMANGNTPDIEIYNVFGEKVYSAEAIPINHEPLTINLSSQPKGIYFLRISDLSEQLKAEGDVVINKKIVIQK